MHAASSDDDEIMEVPPSLNRSLLKSKNIGKGRQRASSNIKVSYYYIFYLQSNIIIA